MTIDIVGGFYRETCHFPFTYDYYGSGGRAAAVLDGIDEEVTLHTYIPAHWRGFLDQLPSHDNLTIQYSHTNQGISFHYHHGLAPPSINPPLHRIRQYPQIEVHTDLAILFGMLECGLKATADCAVYDPQSETDPIPFASTGSSVNLLSIVANQREVLKLSGQDNVEAAAFTLLNGTADVVIVKNGLFGAQVYEHNGTITQIPAFRTSSLTKIGTGDIFTTVYGYYWGAEGVPPPDAARRAATATALYAQFGIYELVLLDKKMKQVLELQEIASPRTKAEDKTVYIGGPFFGVGQRWIIESAVAAIRKLGLGAFNPRTDAGEDLPSRYVRRDLEGIDHCDSMLAILEDYDPGTLFEIGYAVKIGKPVCVYYPEAKHNEHGLTMINHTHCKTFRQIDAAIYNAAWDAIS